MVNTASRGARGALSSSVPRPRGSHAYGRAWQVSRRARGQPPPRHDPGPAEWHLPDRFAVDAAAPVPSLAWNGATRCWIGWCAWFFGVYYQGRRSSCPLRGASRLPCQMGAGDVLRVVGGNGLRWMDAGSQYASIVLVKTLCGGGYYGIDPQRR